MKTAIQGLEVDDVLIAKLSGFDIALVVLGLGVPDSPQQSISEQYISASVVPSSYWGLAGNKGI